MAQLRVADCVVSDAWFLLSIAKLLGRPTDTYPQRDARDPSATADRIQFQNARLARSDRSPYRSSAHSRSKLFRIYCVVPLAWNLLEQIAAHGKESASSNRLGARCFFLEGFRCNISINARWRHRKPKPALAPWNRDQLSDSTRGN